MDQTVVNSRTRARGARIAPQVAHKFAVGSSVIQKIGHQSQRVPFTVVRHMPDGGQGPQYRLKSAVDGHERVAFEAALEQPQPEDIGA